MAVVTLVQTDTDLTPSVSTYCSTAADDPAQQDVRKDATVGGSIGSVEATIEINKSDVESGLFFGSGAIGFTDWAGGTYTLPINITTPDADCDVVKVSVCRMNSSGVSQESLGSWTGIRTLDTAQVESFDITGSSTTALDTDWLLFIVEIDNNSTPSDGTIGVTPDQTITTPLSATTDHTANAALSGVATMASVGSVTRSGAAALVCTGTLLADGINVKEAAAQLNATGSVTATASLLHLASMTLDGVGTMIANGSAQAIHDGAAALDGVASLVQIARGFYLNDSTVSIPNTYTEIDLATGDVPSLKTHHMGAIVRGSTENGYLGYYDAGEGKWVIAKAVDGLVTELASTTETFTNCSLRLTASGTSLTLTVDGVIKVQTTDSTHTAAGEGGIYAAKMLRTYAANEFLNGDNLQIYEGSEPPVTASLAAVAAITASAVETHAATLDIFGTVVRAMAGRVYLDGAASEISDDYNDTHSLAIISGTGSGQSEQVVDYVVESVTNLALYSEQLDNVAWNNNAQGLTVTPDTVVAPDGLTTADFLQEDSNDNYHRRGHEIGSTVGTARRFSVFVKAAGRTHARGWSWIGGDSSGQYFDLSAVTATGTANPTIEPVGNGWFRCAFDIGSVQNSSVVFGPADGVVTGTNSYTGDGSSGIYAWGAQIVYGSSTQEYVQTTSTSATETVRVAYLANDLGTIPDSSSEYRALEHGTATLAAAGTSETIHLAAAALDAVGALDASAATDKSGELSLSGVATIAADGALTKTGAVALEGVATTIQTGSYLRAAAMALDAAASVDMLGVVSRAGYAALDSAATIVAAGSTGTTHYAAMAVEGDATIGLTARADYAAAMALTGTASKFFVGVAVRHAAAALDATAEQLASGVTDLGGVLAVDGIAILGATPSAIRSSAAALSGIATLEATAQSTAIHDAEASLNGVGTLVSTGTRELGGALALTGEGTLLPSGSIIHSAAMALDASATTNSSASTIHSASIALSADASVALSAVEVFGGAMALDGTATMTPAAVGSFAAHLTLASVATLLGEEADLIVFDRFTESSETPLTSHTGDTGATWALTGDNILTISDAGIVRIQ